jgi:hypothetical protein
VTGAADTGAVESKSAEAARTSERMKNPL